MSSTEPVDSWVTDPSSLGPIYPLVGWELLMLGLCVAFSIAFMVWKLKTEHEHYRERVEHLREEGKLAKALGLQSGSANLGDEMT